MMKTVLYDFKTSKESWFEQAASLYHEKINHYCQFEIQSLKPSKLDRDDATAKRKIETQELLKKITSDDYVILFDEKGKNLDSIQFSKTIENSFTSGKKRLVFIIGGAFGVDEDIKNRAQLKVSFSPMVMNHLVAETVALEQIYRALTIIKRIPYHNI